MKSLTVRLGLKLKEEPPVKGSSWEGGQKLTQQYDDTDKDRYDGPSAQSSSNDSLHVHAVSVVIALADFDPQ